MNEVNQTRVAYDAHGRRTTYEEIEVGADLGSIEWVPTKEDVERQCVLDDEYHAWYSLSSPWGGTIAPPQIQYRPVRWLVSRTYNIRGVFYKWEFENIKPIKPDTKIIITGKIAAKWIRKDREFVKYVAEGRDGNGELLFTTGRTHVLDVIKTTAPREGSGVDSGIKKEKI